MKALFGTVVGFLLLGAVAMALFVTVVTPFVMVQKAQAESWPSRKGVVTSAYAAHRRGSKGWYWSPAICGTYLDNGEKFCATRIRFGGFIFGDGKEVANEAVAKYPAGRTIDVHYNPDNPRETLLEAHSSWREMIALLALGIAFLLVPVVLWAFRRKIGPERDDAARS